MMETSPLTLDVENGVAAIRLDRPRSLNAINVALARALLDALREIAARQDMRAVLIMGNGRAFCAGGDVAQFASGDDHAKAVEATISAFHPAIGALAELPIPSVAAVHGAVAGAGFSLMMACDLAIAAATTRFSMAYSLIGGTLDGSASWTLPRLVGIRKAKELALLSETIGADEAERLGLVNAVAPDEEFEARGVAMARRLAVGPTKSYAIIKRLIDGAFDTPLSQQLEAEREGFLSACATADFSEGISAFFEKRPPRFEGK